MKSTDFFGKLTSRYLWFNFAAMAVVVVVACVAVKYGIDLYTHHGEEIVVPNLRGKSFDAEVQSLKRKGLLIVVNDTGYNEKLPAGCILEQTPEAGEVVKSGRVIYVTINASSPRPLVIPDLIENSSYRKAFTILTNMGFEVVQPEYVSGEKDWVYGIKANGVSVNAGDQVSPNERITIVVGDGQLQETDSIDYVDPTTDVDPYEEMPSEEPATEEPQGDKDEFQEVKGPE